jgi:hypothetical protein
MNTIDIAKYLKDPASGSILTIIGIFVALILGAVTIYITIKLSQKKSLIYSITSSLNVLDFGNDNITNLLVYM